MPSYKVLEQALSRHLPSQQNSAKGKKRSFCHPNPHPQVKAKAKKKMQRRYYWKALNTTPTFKSWIPPTSSNPRHVAPNSCRKANSGEKAWQLTPPSPLQPYSLLQDRQKRVTQGCQGPQAPDQEGSKETKCHWSSQDQHPYQAWWRKKVQSVNSWLQHSECYQQN